MVVTLHTQELQTLAQVRAFVSGNEAISFTLTDRTADYSCTTDTLRQFQRVLHTHRQRRAAPVLLLAEIDALHDTLSGPPHASFVSRRKVQLRPASSGWQVFPSAICTTCANIRLINLNANHRQDPDPSDQNQYRREEHTLSQQLSKISARG